ncbi:putative retrovirus-related Pol polyprotein from transposon gypsy [Penaeus vannamei]|uniref:Putative retrovirus-related Pol polyprotein from transposon gypsy n=1 Tax=Penaeus vannamei TaxID=6689 RepID=A0A3R7QDH5_PENVA|nr:putative retrovirus-related Pol polyprotein from transposon gypsy [Penaeus vannamei]
MGTPQLTAAAQRGSLDDSSTSRALTPAVSYVVARESVPHFKGDTSASQPLKRNQDVEAWIRSIENLVKPPTDEAYIQAARANCRGPAELIINSPLFDFIRDWETFKASLRTKFRGTYTSADFYKVLYENRMSSVQAPMDFYLQLEGHVYQGYRDHREAIGDPSELVRRVFLSGIPSWLRDFLAVKDDCSPMQLAETAQRIWNSRNGIRNQLLDISLQMSFAWMTTVTTATILIAHPELGTSTHNTSECRAASYVTSARNRPHPSRDITCYRCRRSGHMARQCPFPSGQQGEAPSPAGGVPEGAVTSTSTQTETTMSQIAMLSSLGLSGRPLVGLNINGKTTLCFIDTGSEATLIKPSAVAMIVSHQKLQHRTSTKILRGVTGQPLQVSTEVTLHFQMAEDSVIVHQASVVDVSFPGDILIGMDLLRRLDFTFSSEASTGNATITLQGHKFSVVYTDAESLKICCIKPLSPTEDASEDAPVSAQDPQTAESQGLLVIFLRSGYTLHLRMILGQCPLPFHRPRICFNLFRGVNGTPICVPKPFLLHGRLQLASRGWGLSRAPH